MIYCYFCICSPFNLVSSQVDSYQFQMQASLEEKFKGAFYPKQMRGHLMFPLDLFDPLNLWEEGSVIFEAGSDFQILCKPTFK